MLIKLRVPGIDVAFHPCHPAPTFPIKYSTSNMHEHHQCSFGHTVPATGLLPDITRRIMHLDCPFKHERMALMAMPGCRHHLQSVWGRVLCIFNFKFHFKCILLKKITSWRMLNTHSPSFIFFLQKHAKNPDSVLLPFQTKCQLKAKALGSSEYHS